jgi:glycosyltransferase involved in cell wall biosynthesis
MRVGIFTDSYTPDVNGVVTIIKMMVRELSRRGHEVYVFCPSNPKEASREPGVFRFPSMEFVFYRGMRIAIPYNRRAFHIIPTLDIIHSHSPGPTGLLALWSAEYHKIPHIHTYHDLYIDYRKYLPLLIRPTPGTVKRMSKLICNRCDAIIAPSEQMKKELLSYGVSRLIYPLPFGVDEEEFSHDITWNARAELNLPTEDILLYAGRLGREKNLDFLLRAFGLVQAKRPGARLVIAGDGPHRNALKAYAETLKLTPYITFTGFIDRNELIDLYKQATVFVFASKTDTQGLVVMEAMMAGAPVVAVNVLGPVDVISSGKTGFLVNPEENEFADTCLRLLENEEERKRMGVAAHEWALGHTSQHSMAQLLEIYRKYASEKAQK